MPKGHHVYTLILSHPKLLGLYTWQLIHTTVKGIFSSLKKKKSINWCYSPDLEASLHLNMKKLTLEKKSTEIEEDNESNIPP